MWLQFKKLVFSSQSQVRLYVLPCSAIPGSTILHCSGEQVNAAVLGAEIFEMLIFEMLKLGQNPLLHNFFETDLGSGLRIIY